MTRRRIGSARFRPQAAPVQSRMADSARRYAYVQLSRWDFGVFRLLGPGLGNLLFPWARAVCAARRYGLDVIWPTWPQVKVGPYVRRESDRRFYSDLFRNPGHYAGGLEKLRVLSLGARRGEGALVTTKFGDPKGSRLRPRIFTFRGMQGMFRPLQEHRALVRKELLRMTRQRHIAGMSHDFRRSITVHVRLGDFRITDEDALRQGALNMKLPLGWITDTVEAFRSAVGETWPVWVFSDATDDELAEILRLEDAYRLRFGSALADMLAMSCSAVLLPSSTFSWWSAFLGEVPTIYYPGQRRWLIPHVPDGEIEREPGAAIPRSFVETVLRADEVSRA